jgi:hypothetical protein
MFKRARNVVVKPSNGALDLAILFDCLSPSLRALRGCRRGRRKKNKTGSPKTSNN